MRSIPVLNERKTYYPAKTPLAFLYCANLSRKPCKSSFKTNTPHPQVEKAPFVMHIALLTQED